MAPGRDAALLAAAQAAGGPAGTHVPFLGCSGQGQAVPTQGSHTALGAAAACQKRRQGTAGTPATGREQGRPWVPPAWRQSAAPPYLVIQDLPSHDLRKRFSEGWSPSPGAEWALRWVAPTTAMPQPGRVVCLALVPPTTASTPAPSIPLPLPRCKLRHCFFCNKSWPGKTEGMKDAREHG